MQAFVGEMDRLAEVNDDFRHVLFTGVNAQLVAMLLQPHEEIGLERHEVDQLFLIVEGIAEFAIADELHEVEEGAIVIVPAGTRHNVTNVGDDPLRLLTIYAPPQHHAGTVHHLASDAIREELILPR